MNFALRFPTGTLPGQRMHSTTNNSGMLTFVSLLSALLATLKLLGEPTLTWFWVFSPLWITALSVPVLFLIIALRCAYVHWRDQRSKPAASPLEARV